MSKLKACPFCNGAAVLMGLNYRGPAQVYDVRVGCFDCHATGECVLVEADENARENEASAARDAIAAWNRRAPLPVVTREELARLIDPEAFGLPSIVNNLGEDYLTDRDEASAKGDAILALLREKGVVG